MRIGFFNVTLVLSLVFGAKKALGVWIDEVDESTAGELETTERLKAVTAKPMIDCPANDILSVGGCACYLLQKNDILPDSMWKLCNSVHKERPENLKAKCKDEFYKKDKSNRLFLDEDAVFFMVSNMSDVCKPIGGMDTTMVLPTPYPSTFPERGTMPKPWPAFPTELTEDPAPINDTRSIEEIMFDEFHDFERRLRSGKRLAALSDRGKYYYCCKLNYFPMVQKVSACVIKNRCGHMRCDEK